jgi:hypothetical protein
MSDVFHRPTRIDPPAAVRGEGLYTVDAQERRPTARGRHPGPAAIAAAP